MQLADQLVCPAGREDCSLCVAAGSTGVVQAKKVQDLPSVHAPAARRFGLGGDPMAMEAIMRADSQARRDPVIAYLHTQLEAKGMTLADMPGNNWLIR